jgi:DNA repair protein RecO (recombination protein O)
MSQGELGVVLKTTALRESDLLVTLYTETHGRVAAVARGARKSQRRFAGALQLLVLGRYQLGRRPRGELWGLEGGEVVREWTQLAADVYAVAHASYLAELVAELLPAEAPDPHVLEIVVALWDSLAEGGPSPGALRAVELELLELAGHQPALHGCAACGATDLATAAVFDPWRGGAVCRRCAATSRGAGVRPIDPGALGYLRAAAAATTLGAARALDVDPAFSPADRAAGRDAMLAMVGGLVARPLKSLTYIAKLAAAGRGS